MPEAPAIVALESQVADLQRRLAVLEARQWRVAVLEQRQADAALADLQRRVAVLEASTVAVEKHGISIMGTHFSWPSRESVCVPESPLLPEAAPRGPQASIDTSRFELEPLTSPAPSPAARASPPTQTPTAGGSAGQSACR